MAKRSGHYEPLPEIPARLPTIANKLMKHLQGMMAKHLGVKGREPSYKALVEQYTPALGHSATPDPLPSIRSSSKSGYEPRPIPTRRYVSETEDELLSDQREVSRQTSHSSSVTDTTRARGTSDEHRELPGLSPPASPPDADRRGGQQKSDI